MRCNTVILFTYKGQNLRKKLYPWVPPKVTKNRVMDMNFWAPFVRFFCTERRERRKGVILASVTENLYRNPKWNFFVFELRLGQEGAFNWTPPPLPYFFWGGWDSPGSMTCRQKVALYVCSSKGCCRESCAPELDKRWWWDLGDFRISASWRSLLQKLSKS